MCAIGKLSLIKAQSALTDSGRWPCVEIHCKLDYYPTYMDFKLHL